MIESDKKESDKKTCRSLMVELSSFKGKEKPEIQDRYLMSPQFANREMRNKGLV